MMLMDGTEVLNIAPFSNQDWAYLAEKGLTLLAHDRSQIRFLHEFAETNGLYRVRDHLRMMAQEYGITRKIDDSMYGILRKLMRKDLERYGLQDEFDQLYSEIPLALERMNASGITPVPAVKAPEPKSGLRGLFSRSNEWQREERTRVFSACSIIYLAYVGFQYDHNMDRILNVGYTRND